MAPELFSALAVMAHKKRKADPEKYAAWKNAIGSAQKAYRARVRAELEELRALKAAKK